MIRKVQRNC